MAKVIVSDMGHGVDPHRMELLMEAVWQLDSLVIGLKSEAYRRSVSVDFEVLAQAMLPRMGELTSLAMACFDELDAPVEELMSKLQGRQV